jgi:hypothetical protein
MFVYFTTRPPDIEPSRNKYASHNKNEEINFDLQGFHFISFKKEKKNISINADRLIIQKQSVGFFRFTLLNEVKFTNASVVLYETTPPASATTASSKLKQAKIAHTTAPDTASETVSFNGIYSEEIFGLFPVKRIASFKLEPVSIELHNNGSVVSRISANSATIRLKQRDMLFEKNVRVDSDNKLLMADNLRFYPNNSTIKIDQNYILDTSQRRWS